MNAAASPNAALQGPAVECVDESLVEACLAGDQRAWELLIARYKGLIYSFPRRYGAGVEDAADVFQLVCADLFLALPRLRNPGSVRAWISKVAAHQAYNWKRRHLLRVRREGEEVDPSTVAAPRTLNDVEDENAAMIRAAVAQLPARYRTVIQLLFLEEPPLPYQMVAEHLGVAPGSVSFLRARGLKKLAKILDHRAAVEHVPHV